MHIGPTVLANAMYCESLRSGRCASSSMSRLRQPRSFGRDQASRLASQANSRQSRSPCISLMVLFRQRKFSETRVASLSSSQPKTYFPWILQFAGPPAGASPTESSIRRSRLEVLYRKDYVLCPRPSRISVAEKGRASYTPARIGFGLRISRELNVGVSKLPGF